MSWTSDTQVSPAWFWGQSSKRQNKGALLPSDSSSVPRFPLIDSWDTPPFLPTDHNSHTCVLSRKWRAAGNNEPGDTPGQVGPVPSIDTRRV